MWCVILNFMLFFKGGVTTELHALGHLHRFSKCFSFCTLIYISHSLKLKSKAIFCRNFKNFSSDAFREYLLSKLSMKNINTSANGLEKFLNICVSALDSFAPRKKKC